MSLSAAQHFANVNPPPWTCVSCHRPITHIGGDPTRFGQSLHVSGDGAEHWECYRAKRRQAV